MNTIPPGFIDTPMLRVSEEKGLLGEGVEAHEHSGSVEALQASSWHDWYVSAEIALDDSRRRCDTVVVGGLSMGAVLALMLAARRKSDVPGCALYAPTLRLDGWGVPWHARLFGLVHQKWLANWFDFAEREPYGIKDPRVRALVSAAIESGDSAKAGMFMVPGGSMLELRHLVNAVRRRAHEVTQPVLLVHPRQDDRADLVDAFWLQRHLGGRVDAVVLDDSYHVVTMDRQRDIVAERTVALAQSLSARSGNATPPPSSGPDAQAARHHRRVASLIAMRPSGWLVYQFQRRGMGQHASGLGLASVVGC